MSAPQFLLQAALNRLGARVGSGLLDTAAGLAVLAQDAPRRLRESVRTPRCLTSPNPRARASQ